MIDFASKDGAIRLRDHLKAYWRERGYEIEVEVIEMGFTPTMRSVRYDVRTNLVNGRPPASARIRKEAA